MKADLLIDTNCQLGEGPMWHSALNKFFWVDIEKRHIHSYSPSTRERESMECDCMPGAIVPIDNTHFLVAFEDGIAVLNWDDKSIVYRNSLGSNTPMVRANDGKCDPNGDFWIGTMHLNLEVGAGALYQVSPDFTSELKFPQRTISNGIAWSADGKTMYYIDTSEHKVRAFDFDHGMLANERDVIHMDPRLGDPDGMTIDTEDKLWIAHWGGFCVRRWDPLNGEIMDEVSVAAPHVTSCCFGGDDLNTLYITTATSGMSPSQLRKHPQSGGIFSIVPGVKGTKTHFFKAKL